MKSRRTFLASLGAAAAAGLAGCLGPEPTIESRSIETVKAQCIDEKTETSGTIKPTDGEAIQFSGTIPENHSAYEANASYRFKGQTLVINVKTKRTSSIIIECPAKVEYEGEVTVSAVNKIELQNKGKTVDTYTL